MLSTKQSINYIIFDDDLKKLEEVMKKLYTENRLSGDEMRDMAEKLRLITEAIKHFPNIEYEDNNE